MDFENTLPIPDTMQNFKNLSPSDCYEFPPRYKCLLMYQTPWAGGPRVVVSTAAFHARVRGSVPGLGGLRETNNVSSPSTCESQYCGEPP